MPGGGEPASPLRRSAINQAGNEMADITVRDRLTADLAELLSGNSPIETGRSALLIDKLFTLRIVLGRMPGDAELNELLANTETYREFLSGVLESGEFSGRFDFIPPGKQFMSEINGFRFWFNTADREMGVLMGAGGYEPETVRFMKQVIKPGMRCLDIGAQTGFFTCLMASLVGVTGEVIAFEPYSSSYEVLLKNVAENNWESRVGLHNTAVSHSNSEITAGIVAGMVVADENGAVAIKCVRLDDLELDRIDFVKIDIEGHEPSAIRGMQRLLTEDSPIILTEINEYWLRRAGSSAGAYIALLRDLGYDLFELGKELSPLGDYQPKDVLENINVVGVPRGSDLGMEPTRRRKWWRRS